MNTTIDGEHALATTTDSANAITKYQADQVERLRKNLQSLTKLVEMYPLKPGINAAARTRIVNALRTAATDARDIEKQRETLKEAPLRECQQIDAQARLLKAEIATIVDPIAKQVQALEDAEARAIAEAEAAQARAIEEAARQAEERRAADEAVIAELQQDAATPEDAAALAELDTEASIDREMQAVVALPRVPVAAPTATRKAPDDHLVIDDARKIPMTSATGQPLWKLDEAAVKRALKAGDKFPGGAHLGPRPRASVKAW